MKKTAALLMALIIAIAMTGCEEEVPEVPVINMESISITSEADEIVLEPGQKKALEFTYAPSDATEKEVTWSSSDETVAKVDKDGNVTTFEKEGSAVITVKAVKGEAADSIKVTVRKTIMMDTITFDPDEEEIKLGLNETKALKYVYTPENSNEKEVTWSSSDETVAKVDKDGNVTTFEKEGSAVITVKAVKGESTDSVKVNVIPRPMKEISIYPFSTELFIGAGQTADFSYKYLPENADRTDVVWSSSNTAVATIDQNGKLKAVAEGKTEITVKSKTEETVSATRMVTVQPYVKTSGLSYIENAEHHHVTKGSDLDINRNVVREPEASNSLIFYESSDPSICEVDPFTGLTYGIKTGKATVTAKCADDPSVSLSIEITVDPAFTFNGGKEFTMFCGQRVGYDDIASLIVREDGRALKIDSMKHLKARYKDYIQIDGKERYLMGTDEGDRNVVELIVSFDDGSMYTTPKINIRFLVDYDVDRIIKVDEDYREILPEGGDFIVRYKSLNPTIATVDPDTGLVHGVSVGTTDIELYNEWGDSCGMYPITVE